MPGAWATWGGLWLLSRQTPGWQIPQALAALSAPEVPLSIPFPGHAPASRWLQTGSPAAHQGWEKPLGLIVACQRELSLRPSFPPRHGVQDPL